jgi:hypothetical protein
MDAEEASRTETGSGVWYVNVGDRSWDDSRRLGFWSAGGGRRYRAAVERLTEGDQIYAYASGCGYVGAGIVTGRAERIEAFLGDRTDIDDVTRAYVRDSLVQKDDDAEYAVSVQWTAVRSLDCAERMKGMFAYPGTACTFKHEETLAFLREHLVGGTMPRELELESPVATVGARSSVRYKPHTVTLPDGAIAVRTWKDVLVAVGNYLIRHEFFRPNLLKSSTGRLLFSEYAKDLKQPGTLVNGWSIETHFSSEQMMRVAKDLLQRAGLDPNCLSVESGIVGDEAI